MRTFWTDPYLTTTQAKILQATPHEKGIALLFDHTLFYPESGGQPADHGWIDDQPLLDIRFEGEGIVHVVKTMPKEEEVTLTLDFSRRYDHMQQHLGQHLLSRGFECVAGANTVGFHLGESVTTIDLDRPVTEEELTEVDTLCNKWIDQARPVRAFFPSEKEKESLQLRKEPVNQEKLRVISIEGVDQAACGGTHPQNTSEVQMIKVIKSEKHRQGLRITFVCGIRARQHYNQLFSLTQALQERLSSGPDTLLSRIEKLMAELVEEKTLRKTYKEALSRSLYPLLAAELKKEGCLIRHFEWEASLVRPLASELLEKVGGCLFFLFGTGDQLTFLLASDKDHQDQLEALFRQLNEVTTVKGGGPPLQKQGQVLGLSASHLMDLLIQ